MMPRLRGLALFLCAVPYWGVAAVSMPVFKAYWIDVPGVSQQEFGVYHFRRSFELSRKPEHFVVHVSADNRYQLFANGKRVGVGPARGDLTHWRFETVDIAPQLHTGRNVLAAVVWNDGRYRAIAQISNQTGFLLDADGENSDLVRTNESWKCVVDRAYAPLPPDREQLTGYRALAANERFDAQQYPWNWEQPEFDDSQWLAAERVSPAALRDARDAPNRWMLVARPIPAEEERAERLTSVRSQQGLTATDQFLQGRGPVTVPAHTKARMLLDQAYLTTAYPELVVSQGAGAQIRLRYAESLYISKGGNGATRDKGNRNEVKGKQIYGDSDLYVADGGLHRRYSPLFWRTYRYIEVEIATTEAPLVIEDLRGVFTAYPFQRQAEFETNDAKVNQELQQILTTGWRTARLCAHETYMDCPYYEQLQYAGDARIQMMVSLYMTGDARLMKNGIALLNSSRTAEGATYSRAPSQLQQYIPPFSLWWIGMVHDYWMYVDDVKFVKEMLPGVRAVLEFYASYQRDSGSLARMPWWNFVDWVKAWKNGEPPADADGSGSAALDLQLLLAYRWAADLESALGSAALAAEYKRAAEQLKTIIVRQDYDAKQQLFADQPSHKSYSQHVNSLAVLAHLLPDEQLQPVLQKTLSDQTLAPSSIYFRAYTNAALREVGMGDKYLEMLGPWRAMLAQGLSTWAETDGPDTRSDCHAWGASPNFELLRTVAGIESAAPGFSKVRIAPNLGELPQVKAHMPHPKGEITVEFKRAGRNLQGEISLPAGVTGEFVWKGEVRRLQAGKNPVNLAQ